MSLGANFLGRFQLNISCNLQIIFHMKMYFLADLEGIACHGRTSRKIVFTWFCFGGCHVQRCQELSKEFKHKTTYFTGHKKSVK